jgi:hypothetical protein
LEVRAALLACRHRLFHLLSDHSKRVRLPHRNSQDWDARVGKRRIHKLVPKTAREALMAPVVQLDNRNYNQP